MQTKKRKGKMVFKSIIGAVCTCLAAVSFNATAIPTQVITFNGTAAEGMSATASGTTYTEAGYSLAISDAGPAFFIDNNDTSFPGLIAFDDDVLEFNSLELAAFIMTKDDGGLFDLFSVETGSLGRDAFDDGSFLFTGIFGAGGTITQTVLGIGSGVTTNLFTGFVGLSSLSVTSNDGFFPVMDNITVAAVSQAVPEPSLFALMFIGLFGMGVLRRRNRNH